MTPLNSFIIQALSEFCSYCGITLQSVESQHRKVLARLSCNRCLYIYAIDSDKLEFVVIDDLNTQTYLAKWMHSKWKFSAVPLCA